MTLVSKKILGIELTISSEQEILEEIQKYLGQIRNPKSEIRKNDNKPLVIYTPNPEIINFAQKDENFARIVNTAQINLPDGAGVVWAVKKLFKMKLTRIPGADFMLQLVKMAEKESLRIGLIGGRGEIALHTLECLKKNHPGLSGWATEGPEIKLPITNYQLQEITNKLITEKTDILFVALGFPKQEYFIDLIKQQLTISNYQLPIVLMAVGGAFDYISGKVPRAPDWMRDMGLEWLFRLVKEPWRLPRQLAGAEFFWRVAKSS